MTNVNPTPPLPPLDKEHMLDLLLDALLECQAQRRREAAQANAAQAAATQATPAPAPGRVQAAPGAPPLAAPLAEGIARPAPETTAPRVPEPGDTAWTPPPPVPLIGLHRTLGRLLLALVVLAVLINIPVTRHGVSLARLWPDSAALVVRDGLLVIGSGPEVYRLEDNKLRWISSLDAFAHLGLSWDDVHRVDDAFIAGFEKGEPIHVLLKCDESPHIYRLEGDQKRWIKDMATFRAEGHVWDDVRFVDCAYLAAIPDGPPIPTDAGAPPQP